MPNIKSAKKRVKLSRKWAARNRTVRARIRTAVKRVRAAEEAEVAEARLRDAVALLDRAARRRIVHPRRAARLKGQLQAHLNGLQQES